ncbi:uncharacterized protein LOC105664375 isoform X1 [Megachile rotundata]|uniref:uncharacterized protein LOC105664375 isoform X1 n=1 Tax=Megachile rotundata TaxID=143995 RepID=UPI003FD235BE
MSSYTSCKVSSIFVLAIAVLWLAIAFTQVEANALQRDLYGPVSGEFLAGYFNDHGKATKFVDEDNGQIRDDAKRVSSRYSRNERVDRLDRNLDQIGGGNLLKRRLESAYEPFWVSSRRNLDQIGGGNLLRSVDERVNRNLDQLGGGNLVRSTSRRNLDQLGGGNLVRSLAEFASELGSRSGNSDS